MDATESFCRELETLAGLEKFNKSIDASLLQNQSKISYFEERLKSLANNNLEQELLHLKQLIASHYERSELLKKSIYEQRMIREVKMGQTLALRDELQKLDNEGLVLLKELAGSRDDLQAANDKLNEIVMAMMKWRAKECPSLVKLLQKRRELQNEIGNYAKSLKLFEQVKLQIGHDEDLVARLKKNLDLKQAQVQQGQESVQAEEESHSHISRVAEQHTFALSTTHSSNWNRFTAPPNDKRGEVSFNNPEAYPATAMQDPVRLQENSESYGMLSPVRASDAKKKEMEDALNCTLPLPSEACELAPPPSHSAADIGASRLMDFRLVGASATSTPIQPMVLCASGKQKKFVVPKVTPIPSHTISTSWTAVDNSYRSAKFDAMKSSTGLFDHLLQSGEIRESGKCHSPTNDLSENVREEGEEQDSQPQVSSVLGGEEGTPLSPNLEQENCSFDLMNQSDYCENEEGMASSTGECRDPVNRQQGKRKSESSPRPATDFFNMPFEQTAQLNASSFFTAQQKGDSGQRGSPQKNDKEQFSFNFGSSFNNQPSSSFFGSFNFQ